MSNFKIKVLILYVALIVQGLTAKASDVTNSVVKVINTSLPFNWIEPYKSPNQQGGSGSGFFIDEDGHFLTNFHVVAEALSLQFQTPILGQETFDCYVIGACPDKDLALVKIDEEALEKIKATNGSVPFLTIGDSDSLTRGTPIETLGFPLDSNTIKTTAGTVSGWQKIFLQNFLKQFSYVEITAPINPGNSGGPTIDESSKVVGINSAMNFGAQNVGFMLPINDLKKAITKLYTTKLLFNPNFGIVAQPSNEYINNFLSNSHNHGFLIKSVAEGSIARQLGITAGNIILKINGFDIDNFGEVQVPWKTDKITINSLMERLGAGDEISFSILNKDGETTFFYTLDENGKPFNNRLKFPPFEEVDYELVGGIVIMEFSINHLAYLAQNNPELGKLTFLSNITKPSLIATFIQSSSEADKNKGGIGQGSIIKEVCGVQISTLQELRNVLQQHLNKGDDFITVLGDDGSFSALKTQKVLRSEEKMAKSFKYNKEHSLILQAVLNS